MRTLKCLALVAVVLVVADLRTSESVAASKGRGKPAPATVREPQPVEDVVDGYGETEDKARKLALERAQKRVRELLVERFRQTSWQPREEQLDTEFLARHGVVTKRGEPEAAPLMGEKMLVARYQVGLTESYLSEVIRQARSEKVQERHLLLGRVLAGILAVVLVAAGYLRLEEMTRGYATQLLRALAIGLLTLVGAGLWLTL